MRFYLRLPAVEFSVLPYTDVVFFGDCLLQDNADRIREGMTIAAFVAWQTLAPHGMKLSWRDYLRRLGLSQEKVSDPRTQKQVLDEAAQLLAEIEREMNV